ncbi:hypothetical protein MHM83_14205 [Tenacibaculum sp. Mcav3-52]|uniref:tetratricopeptide repeat-containing sensor histidine kinase n=1 Tax=Tenacibaculum sp. Mcav3-52 TaxID=2917762 RepID=UPI001EF1D11C|nr:tetratricopeptide repeat-containing sensor histidine kinase [Tenacibaculum sp. Mcav3-52]MCG7503020.1 hypothetical protein [Tenacibaculum sp. Mcav3-52]
MIKILSFFFFVLVFSCKKSIDVQNNEVIKLYSLSKKDSLTTLQKRVFLEKAFEVLKLKRNDSLELKMLNYNVILYRKEKKYKEAIRASRKLLYTAQKYNNEENIGEAYYKMGLYYYRMNIEDSAYVYYKKSLGVYKKLKDSVKIGRRFLNIAIVESNYGDYLKSNTTAVDALKYLNESKKEYIASVYNCLAINARKQKALSKSIEYYNKAIDFSRKKNKIIIYYNNKANIYRDLKEYSKSIKLLKEILKDSLVNKKLKTKAKVIDNLAYTKWLQDSTRNVVADLHLAESIRVAEKDRNGLIASYSHLADYYKDVNVNKSLGYAYKMKSVAEKEKSVYDIIEALDKIKVLEKPEKAIVLANRRSVLKDSIELAKDNTQDKYALIKYESEENEKEAIENKFLAEQQKSQKQLWIFTVILTILSSIVYFFYKREKNKKEKAIEVYNTETRLAKKIHDELANDVYAVMNTLQNTSITDERLLTRVEKIYAQTRDISHENSPVLTGEHFENFLKQLFLDFTNDRCKVIHKGLQEANINQLAKEKQIVVYRALQELLVNMKKYSEATLVLITFSVEKNKLSIAYQDNGIGVENLSVKNGLQNMEIRIKSVGGFITFESKQEKGFQAKFQFKK